MTRKERILRLIERLPGDVDYQRMLYHLTVLKGVEIGVEQMQSGEGIDHDAFLDRLLSEDPFWPPLSPAEPVTDRTAGGAGASRSRSKQQPGRGKAAPGKGKRQ